VEKARERPFPEAQPDRHVRALAFRDGQHLVFTGPRGLPEVWNVESAQQTFSFAGGHLEGKGASSRNLALSADRTWLAQSGLAPRAGSEAVDVSSIIGTRASAAHQREACTAPSQGNGGSMPRGRPPDPHRRRRIVKLRDTGLTYEQIGARLGISHQSVQQAL